jgi:O-antigen/teichoic acid export membrane protein
MMISMGTTLVRDLAFGLAVFCGVASLAVIVLLVVGIVNRLFGRSFFQDAREILILLGIAGVTALVNLLSSRLVLLIGLITVVAVLVLGLIWVVIRFGPRRDAIEKTDTKPPEGPP